LPLIIALSITSILLFVKGIRIESISSAVSPFDSWPKNGEAFLNGTAILLILSVLVCPPLEECPSTIPPI
jgi:hypothetical protein